MEGIEVEDVEVEGVEVEVVMMVEVKVEGIEAASTADSASRSVPTACEY